MMNTTIKEKNEQNINEFYGFIYLVRNCVNCKVYVGKVESPKTIEKRWKDHVREGRNLKESRKKAVSKKIWDTHLNNAIAIYGEDVWEVKRIDDARNAEELNEKERYWIKMYDSENREKGYNMTEGGEGGTFRDESVEKLRNSINAKYKDNAYRERQKKGVKNKRQESNYREKQMEQVKKRNQNPEYIKKLSTAKKRNWNDKKYRNTKTNLVKQQWKNEEIRKKATEGMSKALKSKWQEPEFKKRHLQLPQYQKKAINNAKEFLGDIQAKTPYKALEQKYNMCRKTIIKRLSELLKKFNVKNLLEAQKFLESKDIEKLLKEL